MHFKGFIFHYACVYLYTGVQFLRRPEEGARFPGPGVAGSCGLPNIGTGTQLWSSAGVISPALYFNKFILEAGVWLSSRALARIYKAIGSICRTEKGIKKLSLFFSPPASTHCNPHSDLPLPQCAVRIKWADGLDNDLHTTKCQGRTAMEQSVSSTHTRQNWGWQRQRDSIQRRVWKKADSTPHQLGHLGNYPHPKFIYLQSGHNDLHF